MVSCPEFAPGRDAAVCVCASHWNNHSQHARKSFFDHGDAKRIDMVISACKRDNASPCPKYVPMGDWDLGSEAPDCECGRPRTSHPRREVLEGIREWRRLHSTKKSSKQVCGGFYGSITSPGTCSVCDHRWIDHAPAHRGLVIEAYDSLHQSWCKCVIMNGDIECSCMDYNEIQTALDKIGKKATKESPTVLCSQFIPSAQGNTKCKCGEYFYAHTVTACDGEHSFISWRASHMSNKELIDWFKALPGKNRDERVQSLKKFIDDPHWIFVPPANMINPSTFAIQALLDAVTGSHHIQSPRDLEKQRENAIDALVIGNTQDDDLNLNADVKKWTCYACGQEESLVSGQACPDCAEFITGHSGGGPSLRVSDDQSGS